MTGIKHMTNKFVQWKVAKEVVLDILEKGQKPTKQYLQKQITKRFQDIWLYTTTESKTCLSSAWGLFSPLDSNDIKLLANMYEDIGDYTFQHANFSIEFGAAQEAKEKILEQTLDTITRIVEWKTVEELTISTKADLLFLLLPQQNKKVSLKKNKNNTLQK